MSEWEPPVYDRIEVVPEDLEHFSTMVGGDREVFTTSWEHANGAVSDFPNFAGFSEYGGAIPEGASFSRAYFADLRAQNHLMIDSLMAIGTLEIASMLIHMAYVGTDLGNSGGLGGSFDQYDEDAIQAALSPRMEEEQQDQTEEAESSEDLIDVAEGRFDDVLEAEAEMDADGFGETEPGAPFESDSAAPPVALPGDIREEFWTDLQDEGLILSEDFDDLEDILPNEGTVPDGHPLHEQLAEPRVLE